MLLLRLSIQLLVYQNLKIGLQLGLLVTNRFIVKAIHIIRNIYSNPSKIFDEMMDIKEIVDCADSITECYDELITKSSYYNLLGEGTHTVNGKEIVIDMYDLKTLLWKTLMSVNILEGVRFYVSFACSWAFAELKKMEAMLK